MNRILPEPDLPSPTSYTMQRIDEIETKVNNLILAFRGLSDQMDSKEMAIVDHAQRLSEAEGYINNLLEIRQEATA